MPTFRTTLLLQGRNVGIEVPDPIVEALGGGRRPPVVVTLNGCTYRSTVARMGDRYLVPVAAAIRAETGVEGGEDHDVTLELDDQPRTVDVPEPLAAALEAAGVRDAFDALSYTTRKEHARAVTEAKAAATRDRRIEKIVASLS